MPERICQNEACSLRTKEEEEDCFIFIRSRCVTMITLQLKSLWNIYTTMVFDELAENSGLYAGIHSASDLKLSQKCLDLEACSPAEDEKDTIPDLWMFFW